MLMKLPSQMTLEEVNEEIEVAAIEREFKDINHGRAFIIKQIKKGKIMANEAVNKELENEEAKLEMAKAEKAKPKKEKPVYNFSNDKWNGRRAFTPRGTGKILGWDEAQNRFLVQIGDEQVDLSEGSTRFKAVDDGYRERYVHDNNIRTESGSASIHCGDEVSRSMLGLGQTEVKSVARENGLEEKHDSYQERDLNPGMIRMNIGNMLRAKVNRGEEVTFFGKNPTEAAELRDAQLREEREAAEKEKAAKEKERQEKLKAKAADKKARKEEAEAKKAEAKAKKAEKAATKEAKKEKLKPVDMKAKKNKKAA